MNFGNEIALPENIKRMCDLMVSRGPDEEGYYTSDHSVLGVRRLKVIGLVNGSQPVFSSSQTAACVFNGEIYNYRELRAELEEDGYIFRTSSDAEAIIHLYDKLGPCFADRLRGMFAVAIYDRKAGQLILARDKAGKKPLNYHVTSGGAVIFASELNALASHPALKKTVNAEAVDRFLSFRIIPAPLTIYREVFKVEPGTVLIFEKGKKTEKRYWSFDFRQRYEDTEDRLLAELDERLTEAVRIRLNSEVPVGALLSGGLDSSLVVAIMSRLVNQPVHTFSVGFAEATFNELHHAGIVSDLCKTIHHEYLISPASALQVIEELLINFGEPYAFPSCIATYFMSRIARPFVTVVLTGDGSDEIFCGYNRYKIFNDLPALPQSPGLLRKIDVELLRSGPPDISVEYQSVLTDGLRDSLKRRLYSREFIDSIPGPAPVNYLEELFARNTHLSNRLDRAMEVDCNFWLRDAQLVKMDITSMANSVEARSPLLDEKVVEFATGIHINHKLVGGSEKHILKTLAKKYLPEAITGRPKQELAVPLESWLSAGLRKAITETLLSDAALSRGYFIPDRLIEFVENYGERDSYSIWTLYILEKWHRITETGSLPVSDTDHLAQALC